MQITGDSVTIAILITNKLKLFIYSPSHMLFSMCQYVYTTPTFITKVHYLASYSKQLLK